MILVVGATGNLGGMIARRLLAGGKQVRVLVRSQSAYQPLVEAGAEPVFGDLKDPASLRKACEGVDTLITTANSAMRGGPDNAQTVDLQGNHDLIDAAVASGVKHFIFVSILGADENAPLPFVQAKGKTEKHLKESGLTYTILAPNAFMEVWVGMVVGMPALHGQPVTVIGEGTRKHSFVSMADVGEYAVAAVDHPEARNTTLVIGGPEPLSFRDCAAVYGELLGHEIPLRSVAPGEPVPGLPAPMVGMLAGFDMYDSPIDMTQTSSMFGVTPTPLREAVRRQLASNPGPPQA